VLIQPSHFDGYAAIDKKVRWDLAIRLMDNLSHTKGVQVSLDYLFVVVHPLVYRA
jgi:hypothetical protein